MIMHKHTQFHNASQRGFTLIELLVAISVLLVVILATSRIFGTASQVTGLGQASAMVMQEAAALERRLRDDIARLSHEGFFAIRQVAVPNDINVAAGGTLLNPMLPADAIIRADQLVFFTTNLASPQTLGVSGNNDDLIRAQSLVSRVYYGHGVQLRNGLPADFVGSNISMAHDPGQLAPYSATNFNHLFDLRPWKGNATPQQMVRTRIATSGSGNVFARSNQTAIDGSQPDALSWLLCRQAILLADDDQSTNPADDSKTVYLQELRTARSIFIDHPGHGFTREVRNSRVDGAATRLEDIRRHVQRVTLGNADAGNVRDWNNPAAGGGVNGDQRSIIASSVYYPRAERVAPSARRADQTLTNPVIGSAVSSFIVEWTWDDATGEVLDETGDWLWNGIYLNRFDDTVHQPEQPWFGLNNWLPGMPESYARGVGFMGFNDTFQQPSGVPFWQVANFDIPGPNTLFVTDNLQNGQNNIERYFGPGQQAPINPYGTGNNIRIYEALFGYNRSTPIAPNPNNGGIIEPYQNLGYTPWPTAIRVTAIFHDPAGRLEHGREFQFVIDLPRRTR